MRNPNQKIIVIERDALFGEDYFEGFRQASEVDYETRVLSHFQIMRRGATNESANHPDGNAELNPAFKQPIGYTVIYNPLMQKIFAYQRSSNDKEYGEKRLSGKWSWGFGGHIEPKDTAKADMLKRSILRELQEEAGLNGGQTRLRNLGYINYDSDEVGKVHFGMLYGLPVDAEKIHPKDPEIAVVELLSLSELEEMCTKPQIKVEEWSKIALGPLAKLL